MAEDFNRESFNEELLSQSYAEGVERIVGLKNHHLPFAVPHAILEKRKDFWSDLFHKYTEIPLDDIELDIVTLQPCMELPVHKSLDIIQHWVNTGYLPYKDSKATIDKDAESKTCISLSEESLSLSNPHVVEAKLDQQQGKSCCNDYSSTSSVDTAAYILSNMNTTNKAETMAIVEGAKRGSVIDSQCAENAETLRILQEREKNSRTSMIDDSNNNSEQNAQKTCGVTKWKDTDVQKKAMNREQSLEANVNKNLLNANNKSLNSSNVSSATFLKNQLTPKLNDSRSSLTCFKQRLSNVQTLQTTNDYFVKENVLPENTLKNCHRKKLYTGRDSPVDLFKMKSESKNVMSVSKRNLHPAFDFRNKLSNKCSMLKNRRTRHFQIFNNSSKNASRISTLGKKKRRAGKKKQSTDDSGKTTNNVTKCDETLPINWALLHNFMEDDKDEECDESRQMNVSIMTDESIITRNVSKKATVANKKVNGVTKQVKISSPIVRLKRLSKIDMEKFKRTKSASETSSDAGVTRVSKINSTEKVLRNKTKYSLPKGKSSPNKTLRIADNLNPVVHLKRLPESELQKYKRKNEPGRNLDDLNPVVRLRRLSKTEIERYRTSSGKKTTIVQNDASIRQSPKLKASKCSNSMTNIINLTGEDTASEQSTILMYKCNRDVSFETCNFSILSTSSFKSTSSMSNLKNRETRRVSLDGGSDEIDTKVTRTTSECKNEGVAGKERHKNIVDASESGTMNFRSKIIRSSVVNSMSSPEKVVRISENNCSKTSAYSNKKRRHTLLLSDEDDDFVKLVYCPEDEQKLKLRERYKTLNRNFNHIEQEARSERSDRTSSSIRRLRRSTRRSGSYKSLAELAINNCAAEKEHHLDNSIRNSLLRRSRYSPTNGSFKKGLDNLEVVVENNRNILSNTRIGKRNWNSSVKRLCFKTKTFHSDTDSISTSRCSSNNLSFDDEE